MNFPHDKLIKSVFANEKNAAKYQIGRLNSIVQADESDIGGKGKQNKKQKVLFLLEKDEIWWLAILKENFKN